jgi:hypothetical protein
VSLSAISNALGSNNVQTTIQSRMQQFQTEFQQLGQDLQSGNISAAQSDFATLQQYAPQGSSSQSSNPIAQAFNQPSTDLQAGNTTAAQQDYANIQQDFQNQGTQSQSAQFHHHHHHHGGESQQNGVSQLFQQLGEDLQSGQLSAAQQAYGSLQQDMQMFAGVTAASSSSNSVSVSA